MIYSMSIHWILVYIYASLDCLELHHRSLISILHGSDKYTIALECTHQNPQSFICGCLHLCHLNLLLVGCLPVKSLYAKCVTIAYFSREFFWSTFKYQKLSLISLAQEVMAEYKFLLSLVWPCWELFVTYGIILWYFLICWDSAKCILFFTQLFNTVIIAKPWYRCEIVVWVECETCNLFKHFSRDERQLVDYMQNMLIRSFVRRVMQYCDMASRSEPMPWSHAYTKFDFRIANCGPFLWSCTIMVVSVSSWPVIFDT